LTPEQRKMNAERLLNDDTLRMALDMIQDDAIGVFTYPNSSQEDIMEAHRMVRSLDALRSKLEAFVADGKISERRNR
jgi:hypothetical protein